uniref:Uncharacterized protein n=1 Tax=Panagrolaimus superbus TaxID=310955 RepID=A0A914Y053_9BILA
MLRKPTAKRIKEQRKKELLALTLASTPGTSSAGTPISEGPTTTTTTSAIVASTSRTGRLYNFKRRIMKSRLGKSLSRLEERRSSLGKRPTDSSEEKAVITEKECHSAVEYLEHSSSNSHNDLAGL